MEVHLQGLGLFSIVDGSEVPPPDPAAAVGEGKEPAAPADRAVIREWREYRIRRDMGTATIIQALTIELAMKYRDRELRKDPAVLWKKMETDHRGKVKLGRHYLRRQIANVKLAECGTVDAYVARFQSLCDQIALAGSEISKSERFFHMLEGLPSEWDTFCEIVDTRVTSDEAWEELIPLLLKREADLREKRGISEDTALYGKANKRGQFGKQKGTRGGENNKDKGKDGEKFAGKCNGCGKNGHKKADCWLEEENNEKRPNWWKNKEKDEAKAVTDGESSTQMFAVRDGRNTDRAMAAHAEIEWILDSGCTRHITPHRNEFRTFKPIPDSQHAVDTATGQRVYATGTGNVAMMVNTPEGEVEITITDVLYVEDCETSLVSIDELGWKDVDVQFTKGKSTLWHGGKICAQPRFRDRLHILNSGSRSKPSELSSSYKVSKNNMETWHCWFGHIDPDAIKKIPAMVSGMPPIKKTSGDRCKSCLLGKMTRTPFKNAKVRVTEPLQHVYMDICGPMGVQSIG